MQNSLYSVFLLLLVYAQSISGRIQKLTRVHASGQEDSEVGSLLFSFFILFLLFPLLLPLVFLFQLKRTSSPGDPDLQPG